MTWVKCVVILGVVTLLWAVTGARGDTQVSCVLGDSCVLPCRFQAATDEIIHWLQVQEESLAVHSYYNTKDQLGHQEPRFRGRTSLLHDQISEGNASLTLTRVAVEDKGLYKCYTSTSQGNKEAFISLKVEAPVVTINIRLIENTITCSSKRIYPAPNLTWSTSPVSVLPPHDPPKVQKDSEQLYNISSSLRISAKDTQFSYICNISCNGKAKKATITQLPPVLGSLETEIISIPCTSSNSDLQDFHVRWLFNHTEVLTFDTRRHVPFQEQLVVQEPWKQRMEEVSQSGSLELRASVVQQQGIYTCELSHNGETHVTNTFLEERSFALVRVSGPLVAVVLGVITGITLIIAAVIVTVRFRRKRKENERIKAKQSEQQPSEDHPLQGP